MQILQVHMDENSPVFIFPSSTYFVYVKSVLFCIFRKSRTNKKRELTVMEITPYDDIVKRKEKKCYENVTENG